MKLALLASPAAALLGLALLAAPATRCDAVLVVRSSNASAPSAILGEHQPLAHTWTIYSSSALESLTFQGSGNVFVGYDAELKTDPAPAVHESVHAPVNQHQTKQAPEHQPRPLDLPRLPDMPDMPNLPDLPDMPDMPSPPVELFRATTDGSLSDTNDTQPGAPADSSLRAVAQVVVSGDNEALLNAYSVVVTASGAGDDSRELEIALSAAGASAHGSGYVLAQLFVVQPNALTKVSAISSGDIVVGESVLVAHNSDANVTLSAIGSGDIFVAAPNETLAVRSLTLQTAGSGRVQLQFAAVRVAGTLSLSGVASGDIALLADTVTAQHLATTLVGSADLFVQARSVDAKTLETFVGGSGAVTLAHGGTCVNQSITIAGSGDVRTGSVACERVSVNIFGSGDAVVRASQTLAVTLVASGRVSYVAPAPAQIEVHGAIFRKHLAQRVRPAKANTFHVYKPKRVPVRTPEFVHRRSDKHHHRFTWWGLFGDDDDSDDSSDSSDVAPPSHNNPHFRIEISDGSSHDEIVIDVSDDDSSSDDDNQRPPQPMRLAAASPVAGLHGPSAVAVVGAVGVALVGVGLAAYKYKQRRARQQYRPLF